MKTQECKLNLWMKNINNDYKTKEWKELKIKQFKKWNNLKIIYMKLQKGTWFLPPF